MPKISEMMSSKYLKKEDVGDGVLWTIAKFTREKVAQQGEPAEHKWTVHFEENEKPLVLNTTNLNLLQLICGTDDTDHMIGRCVVLFNDPSVSYAGKMIGGIRVRAPQGRAAREEAQRPRQPTHQDVQRDMRQPGDDDSDIPF